MSDVEILREAAALMRERAGSATPEPWGDPGVDFHYGDYGWYVLGCPAGETDDSEQGKADIKHIASWHPTVALAVAAWLDTVADRDPSGQSVESEPAQAVARTYLGRES